VPASVNRAASGARILAAATTAGTPRAGAGASPAAMR